ncbi:MAG: carotenoid oxygenase family protein [Henriciella sp.]|nr:carotenoid oxygenase family protein [Henriciella sp.]
MSFSRRGFLTTGLAVTAAARTGLGKAMAEPHHNLPDWHVGYRNAPVNGFDPAPMQLVFGKAPSGLSGSLYRNGPAQLHHGKTPASHWFDGDGLVHRIAIDDGKAVHSGRFVQTHKRKEELKAGAFLAPGFGTVGDPSFAVMSPDDVNAANTSVMMVNGELLALWEAGSAFSMDAETLETKGPKVWRADLASMPFLAHPKVEPDGRIWNLGMAGEHMAIYKIAATGTVEDVAIANTGKEYYIHDWAMTERQLVILVQPWINTSPVPPFIDHFVWQPEDGLKILIIDKDDLSSRRWVQAPPRAFYHTGSAWQEADGTLRIDAALYREPILGAGGGTAEITGDWRQEDGFSADFTQIVIPPEGDAYLIETGLDGEFPQVNPDFQGLPRKLTALASGTVPGRPGASALSVHNWERGETDTFEFGYDRMVEEFLFVPKPGGLREEDSWLIGPVLNLKAKAREVCVFDAAHVSDGPICIWRADYTWPLGFHGTWA